MMEFYKVPNQTKINSTLFWKMHIYDKTILNKVMK